MAVRLVPLLAVLLAAPAPAAEPAPAAPAWTRTNAPAGVKLLARSDAAWLAATERVLLRSTDDGRTWQPVKLEPRTVEGLELVPDLALKFTALAAHGATAVVATHDHGVFSSTDGGATWRRILAMPFVEHADVSPAGIALAGLFAAWRSADGGATWTAHCLGLEHGIDAVVSRPDGVLVLSGGRLFRSDLDPGGHRRCAAIPGPELTRLAGAGAAVYRTDGCRLEQSADGLVWRLLRDRCGEQFYMGDSHVAADGEAVLVTDGNGTLLRPGLAGDEVLTPHGSPFSGAAWLVALRGATVVAGNDAGLFRAELSAVPAPAPRALPALEAACAKGEAGACREALLVHGAELTPARRLAASLRACEKGEGPDCARLAGELDSRKDAPKVAAALKAACAKGNGAACLALAGANAAGKGVPKNVAAGNALLRKACEAKAPAVEGCLAWKPGPKDGQAAGALRLRACGLGDHDACAGFEGGDALRLGMGGLMMPHQRWELGCKGGSDAACFRQAQALVGEDLQKGGSLVSNLAPEQPDLLLRLAFEDGKSGRSGWMMRACAFGSETACEFAGASWANEKDGPVMKERAVRVFHHGRQLGCDRGKGHACKVLGDVYKADPARRPRARSMYARGCKLGDEEACAAVRAWQDVLDVAPLGFPLELRGGEHWEAEPAQGLCQRLNRLEPEPSVAVRFCRLPRGTCAGHAGAETNDLPGWVGGYWWKRALERRQADGPVIELCVDRQEGYVAAEVELRAGAPDDSIQHVIRAASLKLGPPPPPTRPFKVRQVPRTMALPLTAQWTTRPDEMGDEEVDRMLQQDGPLDVLWAPMDRQECVSEVKAIGRDAWPPGFGGVFSAWNVFAQTTVKFKGLNRWVICARSAGVEYVVFVSSDEGDFGGRAAAEKLQVLVDAMRAAR